jgi:aminoglycoside/choline kinase family phosphotransferase
MDANPADGEDVRPFACLSQHLRQLGVCAPDVLAADAANGFLLLQDFGDATFTRCLAQGNEIAEDYLYDMAVDVLLHLHDQGHAALADVPAYDAATCQREADLLPDWYIPAATGQALSAAAKAAYHAAWQAILPHIYRVPQTLVLRDFHVDNLVCLHALADLPVANPVAGCGVLDYQDALIGPCTYDVMSLMEDARRDIAPARIIRQQQRYLAHFPALNAEDFLASWAVFAAQRHCKVIGIFARLMVRDDKPIYLQHIPRVWRLLEHHLQNPILAPLAQWIETHIPSHKRSFPA